MRKLQLWMTGVGGRHLTLRDYSCLSGPLILPPNMCTLSSPRWGKNWRDVKPRAETLWERLRQPFSYKPVGATFMHSLSTTPSLKNTD